MRVDNQASWYYRHGQYHNQFKLFVNFPDNQTGYDGVHDDKDRAELNFRVAGYLPHSADVAGYWPGNCESSWGTRIGRLP